MKRNVVPYCWRRAPVLDSEDEFIYRYEDRNVVEDFPVFHIVEDERQPDLEVKESQDVRIFLPRVTLQGHGPETHPMQQEKDVRMPMEDPSSDDDDTLAVHRNCIGKTINLCNTTPGLCRETMNFNSNTNRTLTSGNGTTTINIAEVAANTPTFLKYSSGTRFEEYSSVHKWTVVGLQKWCEGSTSIESAPLTHQNCSKWCMVLTKKAGEFNLSFLLKQSQLNKTLRAKLRADEILPSGTIREVYPSKWYNLKEGEKSETKVFSRVDSVENEIVLQCEICMECIIQDELPVAHTEEAQDGVMRAVDELLHKEVFTDFELHNGGKVLKAHKAILSVRSPYFAAMLQPHTEEAKKGHVEVKDVEPEVLNQVLLYMYTGVAPALKDMALELLIAADKYQLPHLKRQCETHIASCLNVDNAAATAANASVFSCDVLWDRAVCFIKHNLFEVMRSPGWAQTVVAHPEAIQRISEMMG